MNKVKEEPHLNYSDNAHEDTDQEFTEDYDELEDDVVKKEEVEKKFSSETASELNRLTSQLFFDVEEPVQAMRPKPTAKPVEKIISNEQAESTRPKIDYRKKDKRVLFTEMLKGLDETTKAEIKQKVIAEIEAWKISARARRREKLLEFSEKRVDKTENNLSNKDMVITNTIKKYGTKISQRKNILHDLIYS